MHYQPLTTTDYYSLPPQVRFMGGADPSPMVPFTPGVTPLTQSLRPMTVGECPFAWPE